MTINMEFQGVNVLCPKCRLVLKQNDGENKCLCGNLYEFKSFDGIKVFDLLCEEIPGGGGYYGATYKQKRISLKSVKINSSAPAPYHHKGILLRPYLKKKKLVVLDIGCRESPISHLLLPNNFVVGLDIDPNDVFQSNPNVLGKGLQQIVIGDALKMPFQEASFDLILANDILEHLVEPEACLEKIHSILKPNGELLITVPNLVHYSNRLSILAGNGAGFDFNQWLKGKKAYMPINGVLYPDQKKHIRFFTLKSLTKWLEQNDFKIIKKFGYDGLLSRLPLGEKIFRNGCNLVGVIAKLK